MSGKKTNVTDFIDELGAGVFKEKLAHVISDCVMGVMVNGNGKKNGKVSIELSISQLGENEQVIISHKLAHVTPTKRGKRGEEDTTDTVFFVGKGGALTINPPREEDSGQFNLKEVK